MNKQKCISETAKMSLEIQRLTGVMPSNKFGFERFTFENSDTYWNVLEMLNSMNNGYVKVEKFYSTLSIRLCPMETWKAWKAHNDAINSLADVFFEALHQGKTQKEAKEIERQAAIKNGWMAEFNAIYA